MRDLCRDGRRCQRRREMYASIRHMKRSTVFLPEELERDLSVYARRRGRPAASIVREAIAAYIVSERNTNALPSFTGGFDSGHTDTAERHDELLFTNLKPHTSAASQSTTEYCVTPARRRRTR